MQSSQTELRTLMDISPLNMSFSSSLQCHFSPWLLPLIQSLRIGDWRLLVYKEPRSTLKSLSICTEVSLRLFEQTQAEAWFLVHKHSDTTHGCRWKPCCFTNRSDDSPVMGTAWDSNNHCATLTICALHIPAGFHYTRALNFWDRTPAPGNELLIMPLLALCCYLLLPCCHSVAAMYFRQRQARAVPAWTIHWQVEGAQKTKQ